jgi:hypothetical protein
MVLFGRNAFRAGEGGFSPSGNISPTIPPTKMPSRTVPIVLSASMVSPANPIAADWIRPTYSSAADFITLLTRTWTLKLFSELPLTISLPQSMTWHRTQFFLGATVTDVESKVNFDQT